MKDRGGGNDMQQKPSFATSLELWIMQLNSDKLGGPQGAPNPPRQLL